MAGGPGEMSISRPARRAIRCAKSAIRDFLHCADVVNAEMFALLAHQHDCGNEIVDETEAPGLFTGTLKFEPQSTFGLTRRKLMQAQRELRDYVLKAHIRTIDVVWAENQNTIEKFAAEIDRQYFADQFTGAIGIARVMGIRHDQRYVLGLSECLEAFGILLNSMRGSDWRRNAGGRHRSH